MTRAAGVCAAGLLTLFAAPPAFAQGRLPRNARPVGEPTRELRVYTRDELPEGYEDAARAPESKTRILGERAWRDARAYSGDQLEAETALLKQERAVRIAGIARFEQEVREREARMRRNPTEKELDELAYRRALFRYRIAEEQREIRQINRRLESLSRERAGRAGGAAATPEAEARDVANVRQARAAVDLLQEYDRAIEKVLRRDPVTEEDVVYALGLLNEKAEVSDAVTDYFRLLEAEAAARAGAAPAESPKPAQAAGS